MITARDQLAKTEKVTSETFGELFERQVSPLSYSSVDCGEFFRALVRQGTWIVPTYNYWRSISDHSYYGPQGLQERACLRYLPVSLREEWARRYQSDLQKITEEAAQKSRKKFMERLSFVKRLQSAGVGVLAGTDSDMPYTVPGFDLHDELAMLVEGGLTPLEALQAATLNPAKYLGRLDSSGTVERGKVADLVLLEANPLEDIRNVSRISAVIADGRYLSKATLETMLSEMEAAAQRQ
jgi:hypothetical protein